MAARFTKLASSDTQHVASDGGSTSAMRPIPLFFLSFVVGAFSMTAVRLLHPSPPPMTSPADVSSSSSSSSSNSSSSIIGSASLTSDAVAAADEALLQELQPEMRLGSMTLKDFNKRPAAERVLLLVNGQLRDLIRQVKAAGEADALHLDAAIAAAEEEKKAAVSPPSLNVASLPIKIERIAPDNVLDMELSSFEQVEVSSLLEEWKRTKAAKKLPKKEGLLDGCLELERKARRARREFTRARQLKEQAASSTDGLVTIQSKLNEWELDPKFAEMRSPEDMQAKLKDAKEDEDKRKEIAPLAFWHASLNKWINKVDDEHADISKAINDARLRQADADIVFDSKRQEFLKLKDNLFGQCGEKLEHEDWEEDLRKEMIRYKEIIADSKDTWCVDWRVADPTARSRRHVMLPPQRWQRDVSLYSERPVAASFLVLFPKGDERSARAVFESLQKAAVQFRVSNEEQSRALFEIFVALDDPSASLHPWQSLVQSGQGEGILVTPVVFPSTVDPSSAYNRLAAMARGSLLVFCDDAHSLPQEPGWLATVFGVFLSWPRLGVVGFRSDPAEPSEDVEALNMVKKWHEFAQEASIKGLHEKEASVKCHFTQFVSLGPILVDRKLFDKMGGFDESDSRMGRGAAIADFRFGSRVWMSGHQVMRLYGEEFAPFIEKKQPTSVSPWFRPLKDNVGDVDAGWQIAQGPFNEKIDTEIGRLNSMLHP